MGTTTAAAGAAGTSPSAWAPLRSGSFRALWLAALVGLAGVWFQTVGAQWLLISHPHASILVSLVQVATTVAYVLFGLVAGVLADTLDRRLILITVQATVAGLGAVPAALTFAHLMPPALLLLLGFLLGRGAALGTPAYTIVLFGSQALGALVFGAVADILGLVQALLIAAGAAAVAAASIRLWPFLETTGMNRSTVVYWPEPQLASDIDPDGRTITVTVSYRVTTANQRPFFEAMARVRGSRLRTGAVSWALYRDGEHDDTFVELFVVPSWEEHLRQHNERLTGTDRAYQQQATALSEREPVVAHLVDVDVPPRAET